MLASGYERPNTRGRLAYRNIAAGRTASNSGGGGGSDGHFGALHPLGWVTAREDGRLIGFLNVAWDGNRHAFLLDTAVTSHRQRRGIGRRIVAKALEEAHKAGCEWVHVDYEQHLSGFYAACGFSPTAAGFRHVN